MRGFGLPLALPQPVISPPDDSPQRYLHSVLCIAEIISHFDVVALQEVKGSIPGNK